MKWLPKCGDPYIAPFLLRQRQENHKLRQDRAVEQDPDSGKTKEYPPGSIVCKQQFGSEIVIVADTHFKLRAVTRKTTAGLERWLSS